MMVRAKSVLAAMCSTLMISMLGCAQDAAAPSVDVSESAGNSTSTSPVRATLTAPKLQPPSQKNEYTTQGRPEVVFDPCTWISDESVKKAGLFAESRKRGLDLVAEYTFLSCDFESPHWKLSVESGNSTWEEDLKKNGGFSEPLTVNGREAIWVRDPGAFGDCSIHLRTKVGFVMMTTSRTFEGAEAGLDYCDGVLGIAQALEPEIGQEN